MPARAEPEVRLVPGDIRPARHGDLDAIYALNCVAFVEAWSREALAAALMAGHDMLVWPDAAGRLAAYVFCQSVADELHILQLAVAAPYRQRGFGRQLCERMLDHKHRLGVRRAILEVRASNVPALRLYRRLSFVVIGRRRGYYEPVPGASGREDAIVMMRLLQ